MDHARDLELLSPLVNRVVVRTPGRRFAGLVVQGDRLGEWVRLARSSDPEDRVELREQLEDSLRELVRVSESTGIGVPVLPPI